jgi:TolB-like protein
LLALFAFKQGGRGVKEAPPVKLAVLPLENLSGDVAQEYFANEMTDDLIGKLGQISVLRVIGRATVMKLKRTTNSVPEIARQLNVETVVQATLKRERDKVELAIRLFQGQPRILCPLPRSRPARHIRLAE